MVPSAGPTHRSLLWKKNGGGAAASCIAAGEAFTITSSTAPSRASHVRCLKMNRFCEAIVVSAGNWRRTAAAAGPSGKKGPLSLLLTISPNSSVGFSRGMMWHAFLREGGGNSSGLLRSIGRSQRRGRR